MFQSSYRSGLCLCDARSNRPANITANKFLMSQERPLISFDYAAKTVLRDPANFGILSGFLSELLNKDVVVQEILESESLKDNEYEGLNRVNMKVKIDNTEIVVVEIQFEHEADFLQRTLFGVSKAITSQHLKGEKFNDIKKVYSIDIIYFNLSQSLDYIYSGKTHFTGMHTKEELKLAADKKDYYGTECIGEIYPEYYLIEVNKFDKTIRNRFDEWIYFLKTDEVKKEFTAKGLAEAKEKLDFLKLPLEEQAKYDYKKDNESSFKSVMDTARMEGMFAGEKKIFSKVVAKMLSQGKTEKDIAEFLDIPLDKVSLLFLPPYSPDYNPIEKVWANMKKGLVDIIPKCKTLEESILFYFKKYSYY